jgi:AAHS family 4-hydroxybenzoate transporter-like MFS transporter
MNDALNMGALIDERPMNAYRWLIVIVCALAMAVDGFDAQAIGYVAPALVTDLRLDRALLGPIFTAGVLGMGVGNLLLGLVSDRVGRKKMLVVCLLAFAVVTFAKSIASSAQMLIALQFLAGLGIGGAYPNAIALTSEYVPVSRRSTLVTLCSLGYLLGTTVGGFIAAMLIPSFGWRGIFAVGAALPVLVAFAAWRSVPESLEYLATRTDKRGDVTRVLAKIAPDRAVHPDTILITECGKDEQSPLESLFGSGRAAYTILIWMTVPMVLISIYFVFSWLPTLFATAGVSITGSVLAATAFPVGSGFGSLILAPLLKRWWSPIALSGSCMIFAMALAAMGHVTASISWLVAVVFIAGVGSGTQGITHALNVAVYPKAVRSTAVGWATGIGRIGSICGPILGAYLVSMHWPTAHILYAAMIPAWIAAVATALLLVLPGPRRLLRSSFGGAAEKSGRESVTMALDSF